MKASIAFSKPTLIKATPFSCLLANKSSVTSSIESNLVALFNGTKQLKIRYSSLATLWSKTLIANSSNYEKLLAVVTKEFHVIVFDLQKSRVEVIQLPIIEGFLLCSLLIFGNDVFITGFEQILILNWKSKILTGIDFFIPSAIKMLPKRITLGKQKKLAHLWKKRINISKDFSSGNFRILSECNKTSIGGVIGVLYSNQQHSALTRKNNNSTEKANENYYTLCLTKILYERGESVAINKMSIDIEYLSCQNADEYKESCLIVRTDHKCEMTIIGLNSLKRFYSQLLILNNKVSTAIQIKPFSLKLETDNLPNDRYGRISMLVIDIEWTPNNLYGVVLFSSNFFCILSCFGQPLSILHEDTIGCFYVIPTIGKENYTNLKVTDKAVLLYSANGIGVVESELKAQPKDLINMGDFSNSISLAIKTLTMIPQLSLDERVITYLESILSKQERIPDPSFDNINIELKDCSGLESDLIEFKNPFPTEPVMNSNEIVSKLLEIIEGLRWAIEIPDRVFEFSQITLNKQGGTLLLKNEPICYFHFMNMFKRILKKNIKKLTVSNVHYYNMKAIEKSLIENQEKVLLFPRKKALLMLYCLIQFRNFKATSFNVLYIMIEEILKNKYGDKCNFFILVDSMMRILKMSLFSHKGKKQDFFEINHQNLLNDNGELYQTIFETCDKMRSEDSELDSTATHNSIADKRKDIFNKRQISHSLIKSLLEPYETNCMNTMFDYISSTVTENDFKSSDRNKENYLRYLFNASLLIKNGKYDSILTNTKKLVESILNAEYTHETPLTFIVIHSCLLMISLSLINIRSRYTVCLYEISTFFCKVLSGKEMLKCFTQLRRPVKTLEGEIETLSSIPLDCSDEHCVIYGATGILLQISEHKLAIDLLIQTKNPSFILLALQILNNKLNESLSNGDAKAITNYLQFTADKAKALAEEYPSLIAKFVLQNYRLRTEWQILRNIFSTAIMMNTKVAAAVIVQSVLPRLTYNIQCLLQATDLKPEDITKDVLDDFEPDFCPFLKELSERFCRGSIKSCKVFLIKYLYNRNRVTLFCHLLQEAVQIFFSCLNTGIVSFALSEASKSEMLQIAHEIPAELSEELGLTIRRLLNLIWQIALLLSIETLSTAATSSIRSLRLAANLIRLSSIAATEQQELEFIQQGLRTLKTADYSELKEFESDMKSLGNAFEIYTERWNMAIKDEKNEILLLIKKTNPSAFGILKCYISTNVPVADTKDYTKAFYKYHSLDDLFIELISCLQGINDPKDSELVQSLQRAKEVNVNLKKTANCYKDITGIPCDIILTHSGTRWVLEKVKEGSNDEGYKSNQKPYELIGNVKTLRNDQLTMPGKHYTLFNNDIGTCRMANEGIYALPTKARIITNSNLYSIDRTSLHQN